MLAELDQAGAGAIIIAARCSPDTPITQIDPEDATGPCSKGPTTDRLRPEAACTNTV